MDNIENIRTLMRVSYSQNNVDTFMLTQHNHMKYCAKHNYSYIGVNEKYSMFIDIDEIKDLLKRFDIVFISDSDIIFTNENISIFDYAKNYINICIQEWCPNMGSYYNGGFIIFYKKNDLIFDYLDEFKRFQNECIKIQNNKKRIFFNSGIKNTRYNIANYVNYGSQSIFNLAYINHNDKILNGINSINCGDLQSYLPEYIHYCNGEFYDFAKWNKEKFLIHLIGLDPHSKIFKSKFDMIIDFLTKNSIYK